MSVKSGDVGVGAVQGSVKQNIQLLASLQTVSIYAASMGSVVLQAL